ncbi:MAG: citrate/2-methylcitrate synthase, partial [Candidatus Sericytochromatia bacterium]
MAESEILFSITKDHLDTGLRGFPVGTCTTSHVDPLLGLFYSGYAIDKIAHKDPEEVIYLLFNGELPTNEQLEEFKQVIVKHSKLHPGVIESLKHLPKEGHPMKWLMHGLNMMDMYSGKSDYKEDAMNVVAQLPELVAAIYRIRSGWGDPIESKPELGYMENFVHMLQAPNANEHLTKLMKVFNVLHYDHSGGNLSTFVGKAIASGLENMYGSLIGAMAALAGPLHGMANQECLRFLK